MSVKQDQKSVKDISFSLIKKGDLNNLEKHISDLERDVSWVGIGGLSPLHVAARYNQLGICEFLLKQGITPDITEPLSLKTPLHIAAYFGHLEVVKVLKKYRATLDINDSLNSKPLHYAAMGVDKDLILFFLENQTKPSAQSLFGNILDILIRKKNFELVDFFSNIGGIACLDTNYLPYSTPERWGERGWTPFHSAIVSGQEKTFEMLIHKFPYFLSAIKKSKLSYSRIGSDLSILDLALLEGSQNIKQLLNIKNSTYEYRSAYMKRNWYETDFPDRKEICDSIRHRDMKKLHYVIETRGASFLFERRKKNKGSLDPPNALGFAEYVYSLPFFDFILESNLQIPEKEFFPRNKPPGLFFNWALMEAHPRGEMFLKKIGEEIHD